MVCIESASDDNSFPPDLAPERLGSCGLRPSCPAGTDFPSDSPSTLDRPIVNRPGVADVGFEQIRWNPLRLEDGFRCLMVEQISQGIIPGSLPLTLDGSHSSAPTVVRRKVPGETRIEVRAAHLSSERKCPRLGARFRCSITMEISQGNISCVVQLTFDGHRSAPEFSARLSCRDVFRMEVMAIGLRCTKTLPCA